MAPIVSNAPSGTRLVERLRRYDFELVSPLRRLTEQARVREICRFRSEVYCEFGSLPDHIEATIRQTTRSTGRPGTSLRDPNGGWSVAFDARYSTACVCSEIPERVLQNSGCQLAPAARELCLSSIRAFLASRRLADSAVARAGFEDAGREDADHDPHR